MAHTKNTSPFFLYIVGLSCLLQFSLTSCKETKTGPQPDKAEVRTPDSNTTRINDIEGITIDMDINGKNCLTILLAKDGTINRKGSGVVDTTDRNFFIGLSQDNTFDSVAKFITDDLSTYCNKSKPVCDTTKQNCKVSIAFGGYSTSCEIEYCVNGTVKDLPKPILAVIEKAIQATDNWYLRQKKQL